MTFRKCVRWEFRGGVGSVPHIRRIPIEFPESYGPVVGDTRGHQQLGCTLALGTGFLRLGGGRWQPTHRSSLYAFLWLPDIPTS